MTTIRDAYILPSPEDIRAMGFVVKLREADAASDEVKQLVKDYVITPAVEQAMPQILDDMKQVFDRGEDYGRFIHGSFGSGKSHFLTMLSLLIEGAAPAQDKFRPLLAAHRESVRGKGREASDHAEWLERANLLVVRVHMLSVRGRTTSLDRAIYDGLNQALKRRGKQPFEFLNVDAIFAEVRREAQDYGDIVWKRLETAGIVGGREDFEAIASGSPQARERFARSWLAHKGRNPGDAGIDPRWSDGLKRMGEHARAQGFGGVVLMLDEFLLWLAEKSGQEFVQEINNLNVIVDHNTGQRPAPIFVFVARQRNLKEFFPDLVDESKIHEHLDHHSKRFEVTTLNDVELRHIVKGRVLQPRDPAAIAAAVGGLAVRHQKALPSLLAGGDLEYLQDVYPFHPALIEMLVDVTSLMQRERSALRMLYELLVVHYPDLQLGEFLPVGSAFAAIFPEAGVEASKKVELMQDIHHQYYARLAPTMARMAEDNPELSSERRRALDQFVKTVLLAEVSPRLKQGGLTIERLVQLNSADVDGETFRGQVLVAETDLEALSNRLPDLQVIGKGKIATVSYVLGRVSLGEVLGRARSKVDNSGQRFRVFWAALKAALKIGGAKGFEEGGPNEGEWDLQWRKTRRRGQLKLGNVREMSNEDFDPPDGAFKVLIDYPWDDAGHTVEHRPLAHRQVRQVAVIDDLGGGLGGLGHGLVAGLLCCDLDGDLLALLLRGELEAGRGCALDRAAVGVPAVAELGPAGPLARGRGELLAHLGGPRDLRGGRRQDSRRHRHGGRGGGGVLMVGEGAGDRDGQGLAQIGDHRLVGGAGGRADGDAGALPLVAQLRTGRPAGRAGGDLLTHPGRARDRDRACSGREAVAQG